MSCMRFLRWILPVGLIYGAYAYGQSAELKKFEGKPVPNFTMTTFDGKKISKASLMGKPYIIDFWATWCSPCKAASPGLQKIYDKYSKKGLVVIGANMGENPKSMPMALKYPKEHKYTYTFTKNNDKFYASLNMPTGIPCFLFVDKTGKIKAVQTGFRGDLSLNEWDKIAQSML